MDAGVLAVPSVEVTSKDAHRYVGTLLDWAKLLDDPWVAVHLSERAAEVLFEDGLYPLRDQLEKLFTTHGVYEYSVNDVIAVVNRLLQLTPTFETYFSVRDVLHDELTTEPDVLGLCCENALQTDLARCIILLAVLREHCRESFGEHSLILKDTPARKVNVRAHIHELEYERTDIDEEQFVPGYFEGQVVICDDFQSLVQCLDEAYVFLNAADDIGLETGIRLGWYKYRLSTGNTVEWDKAPPLGLGPSFRASFEQLNPTREFTSKLLRAIMETLEGANTSTTHALRKGQGGAAPQRARKRDGAKAWRKDIDRDHHLHYWLSANGRIELASVAYPHDDFTIPE